MTYHAKYFTIKELVHPDLLKVLPENTLWIIFDERILKAADVTRELFGPCTINTSQSYNCGFVPFDSGRDAKFSPHKFARALDLHVVSIEKEAAKIKNDAERKKFKVKEYNKVRERLMLDRRLDSVNFENNVSWLHEDTYSRPNRLFNA